MASSDEPKTIVLTYLVASALFTLATSIIWGVNTATLGFIPQLASTERLESV